MEWPNSGVTAPTPLGEQTTTIPTTTNEIYSEAISTPPPKPTPHQISTTTNGEEQIRIDLPSTSPSSTKSLLRPPAHRHLHPARDAGARQDGPRQYHRHQHRPRPPRPRPPGLDTLMEETRALEDGNAAARHIPVSRDSPTPMVTTGSTAVSSSAAFLLRCSANTAARSSALTPLFSLVDTSGRMTEGLPCRYLRQLVSTTRCCTIFPKLELEIDPPVQTFAMDARTRVPPEDRRITTLAIPAAPLWRPQSAQQNANNLDPLQLSLAISNILVLLSKSSASGKMELPEWVDILKTARFKELPPCICATSIARKIYLRQNIGVGDINTGVQTTCLSKCQSIIFTDMAYAVIQPMPIQVQGLPIVLSGRDMVGIVFSGSGKMLVFVLSLVMVALLEETLMLIVPRKGHFGMIICPFQELAKKTNHVIEEFLVLLKEDWYSEIKPLLYTGGVDMSMQLDVVKKGVHIVVAMPIWLKDLLAKEKMNLVNCRKKILMKEIFYLINVDTSGRHKQEATLFEEMHQVSESTKPDLVISVMDSSLGQAAFDRAQAFKQSISVGVVIVTKIDGHAKGGGALSAVAAIKSQIIFIGTREHIDEFEVFDVKPFASGLLGIGDRSDFMDKIHEVVPTIQSPELLQKLSEGSFILILMYEQFQHLLNMGLISQVFSELMSKGHEKESRAKKLELQLWATSETEYDMLGKSLRKQVESALPSSNKQKCAKDDQCEIKDKDIIEKVVKLPLMFNASDALDNVRFLSLIDKEILSEGDTAKLEIQIKLDKENKLLSVRDRAVGMTKEVLIMNLTTIAKSGTSDFVEGLLFLLRNNTLFLGHSLAMNIVRVVPVTQRIWNPGIHDRLFLFCSTDAQRFDEGCCMGTKLGPPTVHRCQ